VEVVRARRVNFDPVQEILIGQPFLKYSLSGRAATNIAHADKQNLESSVVHFGSARLATWHGLWRFNFAHLEQLFRRDADGFAIHGQDNGGVGLDSQITCALGSALKSRI
jgi:hypothetical protein